MNTSHKHGRHAASREKSSGLSTFKKFTVVSVVGLAAAVSMMSAASDSRIAYITDGDMTYEVTTVDMDTNGILKEAGIELGYHDKTIVTEQSRERIDIDIIRAFPVKISVDGIDKTLDITGGTVADALKLANVKVSANDFISPAQTQELKSETSVKILRGVKIYLTSDGITNIVYVPEGKIGESLEYIGYQITAEESLSIDKDAPVENGMRVNVDKVLNRTVTNKQKIEPKVIVEPCDTLPFGEKKVKQEGKEGTLEITYKEKYLNKVLVEKKEVSKKVLVKAVDKIVLVGTKEEPPVQSVAAESQAVSEADSVNAEEKIFADFDSENTNSASEPEVEQVSENETKSNEDNSVEGNGVDFSYSRVIVGSCTAYTELNGITAMGTSPKVGTVAVDPSIIPYGTRLYICSSDGRYVYGYAIAEDTGTALLAGDIIADLYMDSEEDCLAFGRQEMCIYILN